MNKFLSATVLFFTGVERLLSHAFAATLLHILLPFSRRCVFVLHHRYETDCEVVGRGCIGTPRLF
jgi:hypothetical protein